MFRRPGKNPLDENATIYEEDSITSTYNAYGSKKKESQPLPRIFEPPHPPTMATPMDIHDQSWGVVKEESVPHHFHGMMGEEEPETTLGEGVAFRGELTFERLLRIDGEFEGNLLSQGKIIVGPKGKVKANLNLREAIVEGTVEGNITVQEKLELRGEASVKGDIIAKSLCVDEGVTIDGHVLVAPELQESSPSQE